MTVIETRSEQDPRYIITRIERRKKHDRITGAMRKGFNSRSGMRAMTDKETAQKEQPTVDRAAPMILKLKIIGAIGEDDKIEDVLTAQGHALYEFLMASARIQGIEHNDIRVSFDDIKAFLGISHNARVMDLSEQLRNTVVAYDFIQDGWQRWGEMPLLWHDYLRNQEDGKRYLSYSIPPAIRQVILESDRYAKLEINAFPKFSCKYTARLYPRLALMAQRHSIFVKKKPAWTIKPEELAELIGYRYKGKFHFGNFKARCLDPVKTDINQHVKRFRMNCEPVHGTGRGSPVTRIEITTNTCFASDAGSLSETRKAPLDAEGYLKLNAALQEGTDKYHRIMPSTELVRAAATTMECDVETVVKRWRSALFSAANRCDSIIPETTMMGYQLLSFMHDDGPGYAFEKWVKSLVKPEIAIKEPRVSPGIIWIKYDGTQTQKTGQPIVHNSEPPGPSLSPSEELALCSIDHPHWQELRRPLYDSEYDALVGAFAYLREDFSVSHRKGFLASLDKIMDRTHPADQGKKIKTMADAKVKELRAISLSMN